MTTRDKVANWVSMHNEEALLADGFEDAFLGICEVFGRPPLATYDRDKCIKIIIERSDPNGLTDDGAYEEAVEFFEFNVAGAWVGDSTPAFLTFRDENE
jgi:hypothetical protein